MVERSWPGSIHGCWLTLLLLWSITSAAIAQETEPPQQLPFAVVSVAGVERILSDADYMFAVTGRPELSDLLVGLMSNIGDLKGMDRDRPFGMMFFLQPGLPPQVVAVTFVPVNGVEDLVRTVSRGPITARKTAEGHYEIVGPRDTYHARLRGNYAYISRDETLLDQTFPDPVAMTRTLTARYDLAAMLNVRNIPEGLRIIVVEGLRAGIETDLQQRDDEPDAAYQLRKANGLSLSQFLEQLLTQGNDVTLGLDVSDQHKGAILELSINAKAESKFSEYLHEVGRRPSSFAGLMDTKAPLTVSLSWTLADREKKVVLEALKAAEVSLVQQLALDPTEAAGLSNFFQPLTATAEAGHLDGFLQFSNKPGGDFVLISGARVAQGEQLALGLTEILGHVTEMPGAPEVKLNYDSQLGIALHRLAVGEGSDSLVGKNPRLYVGAAPRAAWFAMGSESALVDLKSAIELHAANAAVPQPQRRDAPLELYFNMRPWIERGSKELDEAEAERNAVVAAAEQAAAAQRGERTESPEEAARRADRAAERAARMQEFRRERHEQALEAFQPGSDTLHVHLRPTENGIRLRLEFGEGFVRYFGLGAARALDRIPLP